MRAHSIALSIALAASATALTGAQADRLQADRLQTAEADAAALAPADPKPDDMARGWFGKALGKAKGFACFERVYDAAHLAKHPLQRVGSMLLLVTGEMVAEDPVANYAFALRMTYKTAPARFVSYGYCGHAAAGSPGLHCGVDCDGGSLDVALAADTRSTLLSLERIAIWPENGSADDDESRDHLDAGADDRSFRLQRIATARCASLANEDEVAEIRRAE